MASADFILDTSRLDIEPAVVANRMKARMHRFGLDYRSSLISSRLSGGSGLNRRTGVLARVASWDVTTEDAPVGTVMTVKAVGPATKYAPLQENGGTVRPVNAKWLWIPLPGNQTSKGVARISPREAIQQGGFISYGKGPIFYGKAQTKAQDKTQGPHPIPLFVLKKSATVPARMGAGQLFRAMLPWLEMGLQEDLTGALTNG